MALKALFINCTLKYSPETSNTHALMKKVAGLMEDLGAETEIVRANDYKIYLGVTSEQVKEDDQWPELYQKVKECNILVLGMPIWMGVRSSVAQLVIERLDGSYSDGDEKTGQFPLYNKVGGVIVTGNEDGAHDCASTTLFNLSHFGCTIPPNADCYWVGDAGPGPSYIEAGADKHLYTNKTARYMAHNLVYMANLLKEKPIPTNLNDLIAEAKKVSD
jgi:multimeric flavodoxin WrbA